MPMMKRVKYFQQPSRLQEDEDLLFEWIETQEDRLKRNRKKALTLDNVLSVQPTDVYHEENVEQWHQWKERLIQREKDKRGEE